MEKNQVLQARLIKEFELQAYELGLVSSHTVFYRWSYRQGAKNLDIEFNGVGAKLQLGETQLCLLSFVELDDMDDKAIQRWISLMFKASFGPPATNQPSEEVQPEALSLRYAAPHLYLARGTKFAGIVSPNGWSGKEALINYPQDEPVLKNYQGDLSLTEMRLIIDEWRKNT